MSALIAATGIAKRFGGEAALQGVDFELEPGEIHALLGENGAGKSTLIKILAGVVQRDRGEIAVNGQSLPQHLSPATSKRAGLAFVHQSLGLIDGLSVAENIALARGYSTRWGLVSHRATERAVGELLENVGISVPAGTLVGELSQDQKVLVAVARALSLEAKAIVLDEVSSSLPAPEVVRLTEGLRSARDRGIGYVYVTHRIEEIFGFADRVTVLRDGRRIRTANIESTSHEEVVDWILGEQRPSTQHARASSAQEDRGEVRLRTSGLCGGSLRSEIDLEVRAGEILGVCGLVGSGSRDLAGLLGGALAPSRGGASLDGVPLPLGDPRALRDAGCTYVPGDRQTAGGVFSMSARENLFLTRLRRGADRDRLVSRPAVERRAAAELGEIYDVRPRDAMDQSLLAFSGGNQQKIIVGRALRKAPKLLVTDDPTAGVDIGSRAKIHALLRMFADSGAVVILASTDFEEVAELASRALVLSHGRLHSVLSGASVTSERLAQASYGSSREHTVTA